MHTSEQQRIEECPHNAHEQQHQNMKINWNTQNNNQPQHVQMEIDQINTSQALTSIHSANNQNASINWQINSIALQNHHHQQNPQQQQNQHQQKQLQKQLQQQHQQEHQQQQQTNGQKIINCQSSGNSGRWQFEHEKLVSTQLQHLGNERSLQICQSSGKLANEQYSLLPVSNQLQNLHSIAENPTYGCLTPSRDQQQHQQHQQQQQEQHWNHSPIQIGQSSGSDLAMPTLHPCDDPSNCQALAVSTIGPQSKRRPFVELLGIILFLLGPQIAQSNDNCDVATPAGNGGGMPPSGNNNNNHSCNDYNKKKKKKHWQRVATPNSSSLQRSADLLDNGQNDGTTSSFTSYRMLEHVAAPAVAADCGRMAAAT
ncbi:hypothetical protein ACLKA7_004904 [Drosophila subpalustris]